MSEFPAELTDRVIDFLHSDKCALAACSLVCKSWSPASRYHLFQVLIINTSSKEQCLFTLFKSMNGPITPSLSSNPDGSRLPRGFEVFNYVQRVFWSVFGPESVTEFLMQIIASLPLLSEIGIACTGDNGYPPLEYLKNLRTLSVYGRLQDSIPGIAKAIANNSGLEFLDISSGEWSDVEAMPYLQDYVPPDSLPLKLRHLGVQGLRLSLNERIISLLRSLTSFEWDNPFVYINSRTDSSAEVWRRLKSEGIQFSKLKTSLMNDDLLDFLFSSRGMTDICLESESDEGSDRLGRRFFQSVLPRHLDTLEVLQINALDDSYWTFGKHNVASILSCTKLRELSIPVSWPRGVELSDGAPVHHLFNSTSELLQLRSLRLITPHYRFDGDEECGTYYYNSVSGAIRDAIGRYNAQICGTRSPVPVVYFHEEKFEWREGRYCEDLSWY